MYAGPEGDAPSFSPAGGKCSLAAARSHAACELRAHAVVGIAHAAMPAATGGPRCAAFVGAALNSKGCPNSFISVETDAACQSFAAIGSKSYGGSVNLASFPPRCFWLNVGGGVFWNTHATGGSNPNAQQLCAGGAPSPPSHP
jgi:hypothetical protein